MCELFQDSWLLFRSALQSGALQPTVLTTHRFQKYDRLQSNHLGTHITYIYTAKMSSSSHCDFFRLFYWHSQNFSVLVPANYLPHLIPYSQRIHSTCGFTLLLFSWSRWKTSSFPLSREEWMTLIWENLQPVSPSRQVRSRAIHPLWMWIAQVHR